MSDRLIIDGAHLSGTGPAFEIDDPATGESIAVVGAASPRQVDEAVVAARVAHPGWEALPQEERSAALHRIASVLDAEREPLAELLTLETGRTLPRNRLYVDFTAQLFRQYAELARAYRGRVVPSNDPGQLSLTLRVPYGVVGCLVPWNYPFLLLAFKAAPALAAGNTIVVKGAVETTQSTLRLAEILAAEVPPGVVNSLAGGADIGAALVEHPGVDMVAFTGSTAAGRAIGAACAARPIPAHLELGGKDPALVFDDVDPRLAARAVVWAAFLNAGQVCTSTERVYVQRSAYDRFVAAAVELTETLIVGDPHDPDTQVGPMRSARGRRRVLDQLAAATAGGARILTGGAAIDGPGFFMAPTVVVDVTHDMDLMREETFGPVLPIVAFDDTAEAFRLASDTPYGLGASIYTGDARIVEEAYRRLRVGTVWVNDPVVDNRAAPFGGMKASGNARELGMEALDSFTSVRAVHWNLELRDKPWWFPYEE